MSTVVLYTGEDTGTIDPARVTRTYNGLTGCACGCGGTYGEPGDKATKRRVNAINKAIAAGTPVKVWLFGDEWCYDLETPSGERCTRVYVSTKEEN